MHHLRDGKKFIVKIDLHTHSLMSDGTDRPSELVNKALSQGITTLALTDHDTVAGWDLSLIHI